MWSGLNDLWIHKAFTDKCVQKRGREGREGESDEKEPAQGVGEAHVATQRQSYTGAA